MVNFLYFLPFKSEFLAILALEGEFFQFLPLKDEFFAVFTLQGWNLCNFYFRELFLGWKVQKIALAMVNSLYCWVFFKWLGFFFLEFCVCVVLSQITRFLLGDLLTFFTLSACIFTIFAFLGFFGMKMDKKFSCNGECLKILIFV